jgi:hypothetical protein
MTDRTPLSVFITTYNNGRTLTACLDSVRWVDEIVALVAATHDWVLLSQTMLHHCWKARKKTEGSA